MAICHSKANLRKVIECAHAMDTFRHFQCLEEFQAEFVIDEDASITAANEDFVVCNDRTVHLSSLDVERFQDLWRISTKDIDIIVFVVHEDKSFTDCLDMLHFCVSDPVDV